MKGVGEFSSIVNMVEDGNFRITTYRTSKGKFYHVFRSFYLDPKSKKWSKKFITILDDNLKDFNCLWRKVCSF